VLLFPIHLHKGPNQNDIPNLAYPTLPNNRMLCAYTATEAVNRMSKEVSRQAFCTPYTRLQKACMQTPKIILKIIVS